MHCILRHFSAPKSARITRWKNGGIHVTAFRNALNGLITNVTLTSTPSLITRQRQNTGDSESRGFEAAIDHHWHDWRGDISYLYADSRYGTGFPHPPGGQEPGFRESHL